MWGCRHVHKLFAISVDGCGCNLRLVAVADTDGRTWTRPLTVWCAYLMNVDLQFWFWNQVNQLTVQWSVITRTIADDKTGYLLSVDFHRCLSLDSCRCGQYFYGYRQTWTPNTPVSTHLEYGIFPKKTIAVNACQATAMEDGHQIHQCPQSLIRYKGEGHGWP